MNDLSSIQGINVGSRLNKLLARNVAQNGGDYHAALAKLERHDKNVTARASHSRTRTGK